MNSSKKKDNDDDALADLKSGKESPGKGSGKRKNLKGQVGSTCIIYSMKRLAKFEEKEGFKDSKIYQAYKLIKNALKLSVHSNDLKDFERLSKAMEHACKILDIDVNTALKEWSNQLNLSSMIADSMFRHAQKDDKTKFAALYSILQNKIFPEFGIVASLWKPKDGIEALKDLLRNSGAIMVHGTFGQLFHQSGSLKRYPEQDTDTRETYFFQKGSYLTKQEIDNIPWTHAVIVDQIKKVKNIDMICFRDPADPSIIGQKEKIYMMSYESFCKRIKDFKNDEVFGYHTQNRT